MEGLRQLSYGYQENKFLVRFIRIWESYSYHAYYATMVNFILLDTNNEQYWAIAPFSERGRLLSFICEGFLYYITGFKIVAAQPSWKPIDTNLTIVFGKNTKIVDYLFRSSIPRLRFNLCTWPQILSGANINAVLGDVGGVIIDVGDIEYHRNNIKRLTLTLLDRSFSRIKVTLWGTLTRQFKIDYKGLRSKNVVLIVTGLLVKNKEGNIYLTSTQATSLFFNPKCQEVHNLGNYITAAYGDFICRIPYEAKKKYRYFPEPDNRTPYLTVHELLGTSLWIYETYRCNVMIVDILLHHPRYDGTCLDCKDSILEHGKPYCCATCGRSFVTPTSSPSIIVHVVDHTGETTFTLQNRELTQLTGYTQEGILRNRRKVHGRDTFPHALGIIQGARCTFEGVLTPSSYSNSTGNFIVQQVIQYTKMQAGTKFD